jgi:predicted ATPase
MPDLKKLSPRRFILTGTPGSGKTAILRGLEERGHCVVEEAATDVIALEQARGIAEPWGNASFIDKIVALQRRRQQRATGAVQFHDRSPVCAHALSLYLRYPASPALSAELERIAADRIYEPRVFFIRNLGFVEKTAARRIDLAGALEFEALHEKVYREMGYELIEVAPAPLDARVGQIERLAVQ